MYTSKSKKSQPKKIVVVHADIQEFCGKRDSFVKDSVDADVVLLAEKV